MSKRLVLLSFFILAVGSLTAQEIIDSVLYIAEGTTEIKKQAYYGRTDFNKVVIPSSVTQISGLAFHSCTKLKEVDIPSSVDSIGNAAFQNDSSLTKVTLPKGISYLGYRVFKNTGITELIIPSSVDSIGKETFNGCFNLKTVVIPDGVQKIDNNAFGNSAITRIEIPASVTTFGTNITTKNAIWAVVKRSPAYYYALNKGFSVDTPPETLEESAAGILSESNQAKIASSEKWTPDDFTTENVRCYWNFSSYLDGAGEYAITFSYTGGACKLCLSDALILIDGNASAYIEEVRSAGNNPRKIEYTVVIHSETKSVELYALARTRGGTESNGTITLKKLVGESMNLTTVDTIYNGQYQHLTMLKELTLGGFVKSIGENAFPASLETLRNYNNAYVDEWATSHGWYLSNVTEDYREYTKDKNKELKREPYMTENDEYWSERRYRFDISELPPMNTERDTIYSLSIPYRIPEDEQKYKNNIEKQDYIGNWKNNTYSYLAETDENNLMLVSVNQSIFIEYYTSTFKKVGEKEIALELPLWGGFFASTDGCYYVVEGQLNPDDSNEVETFRFIKYDKDWNRIQSLSVFGSNTSGPFEASGLTMLDFENLLFVRTAHLIYAGSDGVKHQTNCFFAVDKTDMSLVYKQTGIDASYLQYTSHSFNQLHTIKNGFYAGIDHGDAYPRAIVLGKNKYSISEMKGGACYTTPICKIPGETGNNFTGVKVGGFSSSETHYLTAYTLMDTTNFNQNFRRTQNLYITATPDLLNGFGEHIHRQVTFHEEGSESVRTPHLVKYGKNDFLLLWSREEKVYYMHIDGDGTLGEPYSFDGHLSDCLPILYNGYVTWYVTDGSSLDFYRIDLTDLSKHECFNLHGKTAKEAKEIVCMNSIESVRYYDYFESHFPNVEKIIVDGSVSTVGAYAFHGTKHLTCAVIEDGVQTLENGCFYKCSSNLTIYIPRSVTSIGTDVTSRTATWVVEEGSYAHTYALENNFTVKVISSEEFHNITAIDILIVDDIKIYANNRSIIVENAESEIRVFDATGRLICKNAADNVHTEISMKKSGVYVVKVGTIVKRIFIY